jgi:hypothetical protein
MVYEADFTELDPLFKLLDPLEVVPFTLSTASSPLSWSHLGLLGQAEAFSAYARAVSLESLVSAGLKTERFRAVLPRVFKGAYCLRRIGPAFYFHQILEGLLQYQQDDLPVLEYALFYGLNHFGYSDKSSVIFHTLYERYANIDKENEGLAFLTDILANIYRAAEQAVPLREAFSEKSFQRSLSLQDKLAQHCLIAAHSPFELSAIREDLNALPEQATRSDTRQDIYTVLSRLREHPNTPLEIINAGWVHKMESFSLILAELTEQCLAGASAEAVLNHIKAQVNGLDDLLNKSIETAGVHQLIAPC